MCECIYVYMYRYTCIYACIFVYACASVPPCAHAIYLCMCRLEYIGVNISVRMHVCIYVPAHVCMHICMSLYTHMCVDIYVNIMCVCRGSFTWTALLCPRVGCHFPLLCWWCFPFCPDPPMESAASHGWPSAVFHMKGLHSSLPAAGLHKCPLPQPTN